MRGYQNPLKNERQKMMDEQIHDVHNLLIANLTVFVI